MDHIIGYNNIMPLLVVARDGAFGCLKWYCLEKMLRKRRRQKSTYVVGRSCAAAVP